MFKKDDHILVERKTKITIKEKKKKKKEMKRIF
jgi:hypothetical protein